MCLEIFLFLFTAVEQPVFNKLNLGWQLRANIKLDLCVLHLFLGFAGPVSFLPFSGELTTFRTVCDPGWAGVENVSLFHVCFGLIRPENINKFGGRKRNGKRKHSGLSVFTLPSFNGSCPQFPFSCVSCEVVC